MKKVFVLGANSFSGQDFVDLLLDEPGLQVVGVSRSPERSDLFLKYRMRKDLGRYQYHQLDMNGDSEKLCALFDSEKPDCIVNFAAQSEVAPSWEFPEHWFETNTVALAKLLKHLSKQSYLERYLHVSSPEVYGSCEGTIVETSPVNPSTPYAASKAAADLLLEVYRKQFQFPLLSVRATNVYGARQQLFKIIPRTAIYVKLGKKIDLHGGGVAVKSYIHIRDVSKAELAILRSGTIGEMYHVSPNHGVSVRDVVRQIATTLGKDFEEVVNIAPERPGQDAAYVIDSSKLRKQFKWQPSVSIEAGIAEVIDWVDQYWDTIRQQPLMYEHKR